jgi:hypothetical protein
MYLGPLKCTLTYHRYVTIDTSYVDREPAAVLFVNKRIDEFAINIECVCSMDRCVNCRTTCDGTYCHVCQALQECRDCGRRLSARLFAERNEVCNTCMRRHQRSRHRTALGGVVEEREIPVSEDDRDLRIFIDQNEDNIVQFLDEAINRHG